MTAALPALARLDQLPAVQVRVLRAHLAVLAMGPGSRGLTAEGLAERAHAWADSWAPEHAIFTGPGAVHCDRLAVLGVQRLLPVDLVNLCALALIGDE